MKTKIDISDYLSKIVGPYDTIELMDNITEDDGISWKVSASVLPDAENQTL
jgi:hypothetical protein